jgi:hypothetical protein
MRPTVEQGRAVESVPIQNADLQYDLRIDEAVVSSPLPDGTQRSSKIVIACHTQHLALGKRSGCPMGSPR